MDQMYLLYDKFKLDVFILIELNRMTYISLDSVCKFDKYIVHFIAFFVDCYPLKYNRIIVDVRLYK